MTKVVRELTAQLMRDEARIRQLESNLEAAQERLTSEWAMALERDDSNKRIERARRNVKAIYDATEGYADGAEDATEHDRLCNTVSYLASEALSALASTKETK